MNKLAAVIAASVLSASMPTIAAAELPTQQVLPLAAAQKMVAACLELAGKNKWTMSIAIKDSADDLLAFARMDGAGLETVNFSQMKASTATRFGAPTSGLAKFAFDAKTKAPTALAFFPGIVLFGGGLPIKSAAGQMLGSIGVSGGPMPDSDEKCARAGLDAVKDDLK